MPKETTRKVARRRCHAPATGNRSMSKHLLIWLALGFCSLSLVACSTLQSVGKGVSSSVSNSAADSGVWLSELINGDGEEELTPLPEIDPKVALQLVSKRNLSGDLGRDVPKLYPAHDQDNIIIADANRISLSAYSLESGDRLWKSLIGKKITGGIGLGEGVVLLGTNDAQVFALNAQSGDILWQSTVSSEVLSIPAASDDVVVVNTVDGKLFGLNLSDGKQKWRIEQEVPALTLRGSAAPTADSGLAVSGFANGHLIAVDLHSGLEVWDTVAAFPKGRTELDRMVDATGRLTLSDGVVYASTFQGRLVAVGLESGTLLWDRNISSFSSAAVGPRSLFVSDARNTVWALDRQSGKTLWKQTALRGRRLTGPAIHENHVVVADGEGYLHILDADTGELIGRHQFDDDPVTIDPWVMNDRLYLFNDAGTLIVANSGGTVESPGKPFFSLPALPAILGGKDKSPDPDAKPAPEPEPEPD